MKTTTRKLTVLLADDHPIVREGLKTLVGLQIDMEIVGEAGNGNEACQLAKSLQPDVVVMDVSMPELNGAQATERVRKTCADTKVVALSAHADAVHVRELLAAGAAGYVLKRTAAEELPGAIRIVANGGIYLDPSIAGHVVGGYLGGSPELKNSENLSPREREVLLDVAHGYANREIAERLFISVKTVETHKARILEKLNLRSRADIVRYALRQGWLQDA